MTEQNTQADANDVSIPNSVDAPDDMTEQIEATFGPMSVYVSGTDSEDVEKTFESVWSTVMDTYSTMNDMRDDDDTGTGKTFG